MGTSGTALYEDDAAHDVRREYVELLAHGTPTEATQALIASWAGAIDDVDEGPVFWLALADTQWKYGCLSEDVKAAALEVIDSGRDLRRWESSPLLTRRRAVLQKLKKKLLSPQPKARRPRPQRTAQVQSTTVPSPDGRASATVFNLGGGKPQVQAFRSQIIVEMEASGSRSGGNVFVSDCEYSDISLDWLDPDTLRITYPATANVSNRQTSSSYFGRTLQIVYRKIAD